MNDKETKALRARATRVREAFPKRLDGAAIRRLKADQATAATPDAKADADYAWRLFSDIVLGTSLDFGEFVVTPAAFADRRRRAGDPSARPSDYDCRCPVKDEDGVPICLDKRADCKFKGLRSPASVQWVQWGGGDDAAWFYHARESGMKTMLDLPRPATDPEGLANALHRMRHQSRKASQRRDRVLSEHQAKLPALPDNV